MNVGKASAVVVAVNTAANVGGKASVDVQMFGQLYQHLRYPAWYTPQVNDTVIVDWLGSQPFVLVVLF